MSDPVHIECFYGFAIVAAFLVDFCAVTHVVSVQMFAGACAVASDDVCFITSSVFSCDVCDGQRYSQVYNFSQVLGPVIAQKLHLLKLQMTCFLRQTKAASRC